jgi:hypothetical protein
MKDISPHPDDFANRYENAAAQLFDRIDRACAGEPEWPRRVRAAIEAALAFLAAEPGQLSALAPELTTLVLTPYLGRAEAERIGCAAERG